MKALINFTFLFLFFSIYSQENKLTIIYEQLEDKSYQIKDVNNNSIGFLKYDKFLKQFSYLNINNELVGKEPILNDYQDIVLPFDLKTTTEFLDKTGEPICIRFWDEEEMRFKIFVNGEEIGFIKKNKLKNQWEYFSYISSETNIFSNLYKIEPKPIKSVVSNDKDPNFNNYLKYNNDNNSNNNSNNKYNPLKKNKSKSTIKKVRQRNSSFLLSDVSGRFYVGVDKLYLDKSNDFTIANENGFGITPEYKFELGFFTYSTNLYFGIQFANQKSNTKTEYDDLNDQIWALGFGFGLFRDKVFVKTGLGYHTYNYPTVESFGDFYDIGEEFYGDIGLKFSLINLGGFYILPEVSIDTNGLLSYGLGFAF